MKLNAKNAVIGLLMATGVIGTTIACNQQKNNQVDTPIENAVNVDSTLKAKSDIDSAIFHATQSMNNSLLNSIETTTLEMGKTRKPMLDLLCKTLGVSEEKILELLEDDRKQKQARIIKALEEQTVGIN